MTLREYKMDFWGSMHQLDLDKEYEIIWKPARKLVSLDRIDLIAKIKYVEAYITNINLNYARELYIRSIEACTQGSYSEMGDDKKNSINDYLNVFNTLIDDIRVNGLDDKKSIIPVNARGMIMDGAHRVSIAAYFNMDVPTIYVDYPEKSMDYLFMRKRLMSTSDLDYLITELCKWRSDLFLCCLWPAATGEERRNEAIRLLEENHRIVYKKTINITYNGLKNLIPQIYVTNEWVGGIEDRFVTSLPKVDGCFCEENDQLDIIVFQGDNLNEVVWLKGKMREIFGIAENSLHITDYPHETLALSKMLFNANTIAFLNGASPFKYVKLNRHLIKYKDKIEESKYDVENFVVDSSTVMGLFGVREPEDIDYLSIIQTKDEFDDDMVHNHISEIRHHDAMVDDVVMNPANYFYYFGLKIITLERLIKFKKNRNSKKDIEDIEMLQRFASNKKTFVTSFKQFLQIVKRKVRNLLFRYLQKNRVLYELARKLYHVWRNLKRMIFR